MNSALTLSQSTKALAPWRRVLVLCLAALMASSPVLARGPGRAGMADLTDDPDALAPLRANLPSNIVTGSESMIQLQGQSVSGADFGLNGSLDISVGMDTIAGSPDGMKMGKASYSISGDLVVPLLGVTSNATVNGRAGVPSVKAVLGKFDMIPQLHALKTVETPPVPDLDAFIHDRQAAIALGKALFWESNVGSDGNACASCHFAAGADNRLKNQLSPGLKAGDHAFSRSFQAAEKAILNHLKSMGLEERGHKHKKTATGGGGPNYTLVAADFPFHRLSNPLDRNSDVVFDSDDVVSSQGTFAGDLVSIDKNGSEKCVERPLDEFSVDGLLTRKVAPRNSPTVINAVFNYRNFWDGRANNVFNGNNPFGDRDASARVLDMRGDGTVVPVRMSLPNASLASQATGPALSDFEMSCSGKNFKQLGRKMLPQRALSNQAVHPQDSVLGVLAHASGKGLKSNYADMIKQAFHPRWWAGAGNFNGYTQMESNFSMFWGLAIMMYESTLISDEAPVDKFLGWAGQPGDLNALGKEEQRGLAVFRGKGMCWSCHRGSEFTSAATGLQPTRDTNLTEQMFVGSGQMGLYDNGFYNIGVRPTSEDLGVGDTDPWGQPLSYSREYLNALGGKTAPDAFLVRPCLFAIMSDGRECWTAPDPARTRTAVDGAFKTPTLRNVSLTKPYFHNGSRFSLEQVVEFYNRGGDRRGTDDNDTSGYTAGSATPGGLSNAHPTIQPLGLSDQERKDLVAFLRNGLTDRRVACQQGPFDHPALRLTNGHKGDTRKVRPAGNTGLAQDEYLDLPAVGAAGLHPSECLRNDDGSSVASRGETKNKR